MKSKAIMLEFWDFLFIFEVMCRSKNPDVWSNFNAMYSAIQNKLEYMVLQKHSFTRVTVTENPDLKDQLCG